MKNKHIEYQKEKSRIHAKNFCNDKFYDIKNKIKVFHIYEEKKQLTFWDDVSFKFGNYIIDVSFIHPRMGFKDKCSSIAREYCKEQYESFSDNLLNGTPNYKFLGKNKKRKKIISWTMKPISSDKVDFFKKLNAKSIEVQNSTDYVQKCYLNVTQNKFSIHVSICFPLEINSVEDLVILKEKVIYYLRNHKQFYIDYKDYYYSKEDFKNDNK